MADKYWWPSGGTGTSTGNWNSTTNWSSSSASYVSTTAPTSTDNANFGSYSGASAFTVTVSTLTEVCANLVINNSNMTWAGSAGSAGITIYGGVTVTAFASRTFNGTITFSTANSVILNFGSMTFTSSTFTFNGGGTWTLGSALTNAAGITLVSGTLDTSSSGNYSLTTTGISLGAGTKALNLNASTVTLSATTPVSFLSSSTGFTFNAGTSQINCSSTSPTFDGGNFTFYNVTFTSTSITTCSITGTNTFNNLRFSGRATTGLSTITFSNNQTINGSLTVVAPTTSGSSRYNFQSNVFGFPRTISVSGSASFTDTDFRDITNSGTTWTGTRLGDAGGNSGITFDTPKTVYWNLAGSNNWNANGWATSSTGTPATTNFPLAQDTAIFTDTSPVASSTITLNVAYNLPTIDFSGRSNTLTFATGTISPIAYGSITLSSAITLTGTGTITWRHRSGTATITSVGRTWTQRLAFACIGATTEFGDAFSSTNTLTHSYGTLTNTTYNITATTFDSNNSNTRALNLGSGTWTMTAGGGTSVWTVATTTGLTLNSGNSTISLTSATAKTFYAFGTYYNINQGGAGTLTINGTSTFNNITNTIQPTTILFTSATTYTFQNFSLSGTSGNLVTIITNTSGSFATITKSSGTVSCDYLSIQDIHATGGASWYAGTNSTDVSGNLGWIFTAPPISAGNFFMLFW